MKSNDSGISEKVTLKPYVKATDISFGSEISDEIYMIYEKTGVEVYVDSYKVRDLNMGLTITAANGEETTAEPKIVISDTSVLSIEGDIVKPLKAGSATVTVSIDGLEKSFTVNIHDFDIYDTSNLSTPVTGKDVNISRIAAVGENKTGNRKDFKISSSNSQQSESYYLPNSTYNWCFDYKEDKKSSGDVFVLRYDIRISGDKLTGYVDRSENRDDPKATILILEDNTKIGAIWFQLSH